MAERELEQIAFVDGTFVKKSDNSPVTPQALGNPIVSITAENSEYFLANEGAKEQNILDEVNAFAVTKRNRRDLQYGQRIIAVQLYKI